MPASSGVVNSQDGDSGFLTFQLEAITSGVGLASSPGSNAGAG